MSVLERTTNRIHAHPWRAGTMVVGAVTGVFVIVLGFLGLRQFWRFHLHAYDFGIFSQGTWLLSTLHDPFVTVRGLPLFADHSSYILILIAPLYAVFSTPSTLIVVLVLALAAVAPAAYLVARQAGATPMFAVVSSVMVLMQPALWWHMEDSFHPEALVIPLVVISVWLIQRGHHGWAVAAIMLALTAKEDVGLLIVPLGLVVAWALHERRVGFTIAGLGVGAFLLNFLVLLPAWSPSGELLYSYRYERLGEGPLGIVVGLLTKPDVWWDVLTDPRRIGYVAVLTLALPLCVVAPRWLLVGLPTLLANIFSNHGYQYEVQYHYTAYLIVAVVLASAFGAARASSWNRRWLRTASLVGSVGIGLVVWAIAAPITGWAGSSDHPARIAAIVEQIPDDAGVSAWTTLVPALTERTDVFLFPNPFEEYYYGTSGPYGADGGDIPDPTTVDFVFVRMDSYRSYDDLIDRLIASPEWEVIVDDDPFILIGRT